MHDLTSSEQLQGEHRSLPPEMSETRVDRSKLNQTVNPETTAVTMRDHHPTPAFGYTCHSGIGS